MAKEHPLFVSSLLLLLLVTNPALGFQNLSALSSPNRQALTPYRKNGCSMQKRVTSLSLEAKKDKSMPDQKKKNEWDLGLLLVFMTPWRNPNSIFVYMFLILYGLGKMSEAGITK